MTYVGSAKSSEPEIVVLSHTAVEPIARKLFSGLPTNASGPIEAAVAEFINHMTAGSRTTDSTSQFGERVLEAVLAARRVGEQTPRETDRHDLGSAENAADLLLRSPDLRTTVDGSVSAEPPATEQIRQLRRAVVRAIDASVSPEVVSAHVNADLVL